MYVIFGRVTVTDVARGTSVPAGVIKIASEPAASFGIRTPEIFVPASVLVYA